MPPAISMPRRLVLMARDFNQENKIQIPVLVFYVDQRTGQVLDHEVCSFEDAAVRLVLTGHGAETEDESTTEERR